VPDFVGMSLDKQIARGGHPPILSVLRKPQSDLDWLVKRSFDFAASLGLLIALSPLLALTALAIRLDSPGPILFRQPRLGLNNKEFNVLKFRSMYVEQSDLEARVHHDLYYIDNWSFFFDLRILVMTVVELVRPRNAF
jgi:lipopolysaccharide/colanic/teichoic acid biosynthesis glycosyltransferase